MLGKVVSDLQSNISVGADSISGNLKYVTGYTGFSGNVSEQSGNYLAIHCDAVPTADEITVELINGTVGHPVTLDSDGLIVIRITDVETQYIKVVAKKDGVVFEKTYYLGGLVLAES